MEFERRLYYYGLKANIPFGALTAAAGIFNRVRASRDIAERTKAAADLFQEDDSWRGFIPRELGYRKIASIDLPFTAHVIKAANAVIEDRQRSGGWKKRKNNPFYQCERPEDFINYPDLLNFALSDAVLRIVSDYYGMVPRLQEVGIWLTMPEERDLFSSQLFHLDKPECALLKLFINLDYTTPETGPLTLLPANVSSKVRRATSYEKVYFHEDGRLKDAQVFASCKPSDCVDLSGPSGCGGFADTSHCFHYGSRCATGERKMLAIAFILPHLARTDRTALFDLVPAPEDPVRRLALSGAAFNQPRQ
jgi:hypothetical protein